MAFGRDWKSIAQLTYIVLVRATAVAVVGGLLVLSAARGAEPAPQVKQGHRDLAGLDQRNGRCWKPRNAELEFARQINLARIEAARIGLRLDPELSFVARKHTRKMVADRSLFHSPGKALRQRVTRWASLAENVGVGGGPSDVHAAFMASESHRRNILGRHYRHIGVGSKMKFGRSWVTVIFESKKDPGTTLEMPDC